MSKTMKLIDLKRKRNEKVIKEKKLKVLKIFIIKSNLASSRLQIKRKKKYE
jgi:hypothetical protein